MKITLWILVIEARNAPKTASAYLSREAAKAALAEYCRQSLGESLNDPADVEYTIILYFSRVDDESADIHECTVDVPTPQDTLIDQALGYEGAAFDADADINGADLVEWFSEWRERMKAALGL